MERKNYSLILAGRKFELTSTENADHVERIRFMTEEEINATMKLDRRITFETAAAVTALRFAERIIMLEEECKRLRKEKDDIAEQIKSSSLNEEKDKSVFNGNPSKTFSKSNTNRDNNKLKNTEK